MSISERRQKRPIKLLPLFTSFPLLRKETLVEASTSPTRSFPAFRRFTVAYLPNEPLPLYARTQYLKVVRPGQNKPRSYTPI